MLKKNKYIYFIGSCSFKAEGAVAVLSMTWKKRKNKKGLFCFIPRLKQVEELTQFRVGATKYL